MFSLTIEQKVLLAEKIMGWSNRKPRHKTKEGETCFWVDKLNTLLYMRQDYGEGVYSWRPEINKGDAAELMLALPILELHKFIDGTIRATTNCHTLVRSNNFCETICRLALAHAEELKQ